MEHYKRSFGSQNIDEFKFDCFCGVPFTITFAGPTTEYQYYLIKGKHDRHLVGELELSMLKQSEGTFALAAYTFLYKTVVDLSTNKPGTYEYLCENLADWAVALGVSKALIK